MSKQVKKHFSVVLIILSKTIVNIRTNQGRCLPLHLKRLYSNVDNTSSPPLESNTLNARCLYFYSLIRQRQHLEKCI